MEDEKEVIGQEENLPEAEQPTENEEPIETDAEDVSEDAADPQEEAAEAETENEEAEAQPASDEEMDLDALEFDEEGNIIIPEGIEEEETSKTEEPTSEGEKAPPAQDEKDLEIRRLRDELADLKSQGRDTLKRLGVETEDVMDGLASVAAETADIPREKYDKERAEVRRAEREAEAKRFADFETLAAKDLAELQSFYPETKSYKHVREMPADVLAKFAANRNLGLPAKEAYAAANPDGIRKGAAEIAKKQAMNDTKAHLRSSAPKKGSSHESIRMTRAEYEMWHDMFPDKSDKELVALYKKTKN